MEGLSYSLCCQCAADLGLVVIDMLAVLSQPRHCDHLLAQLQRADQRTGTAVGDNQIRFLLIVPEHLLVQIPVPGIVLGFIFGRARLGHNFIGNSAGFHQFIQGLQQAVKLVIPGSNTYKDQ